MIKKLIFSIFLLIFILGCSHNGVSTPENSSITAFPSWYLNPPRNDNNYVYVTGSGINEKKAVENALSHFIANYSITISSKFQTQMKDYGNGLVDKHTEFDIKSVIKEFEVSNYEVIKKYIYSFNQILVLVRVDTNKLYQNAKNKLDNEFIAYQNRYYSIIRENLLSQFIELKKMYKAMEKRKNYIAVLKVMNKNFNDNIYLSFINAVQRRLYIVKNSLHIMLYSNNRVIAEDVAKYLTSKGIRIGRSNLIIEINVKTRNSIALNRVLKVYQIYLNFVYKNRILGNNFFKIVAPPTANINGYLYDDIKNLALEKFLNLR